MARQLRLTKFRDLLLDDPFFDSLKSGYAEFPKWFSQKLDEDVYVVDDGAEITGMIYLKGEEGPVIDVDPQLPSGKWLKVGTLKIIGRGTKLGERVIKKIFDTAIAAGSDGIYVTVFSIHEQLIKLFKTYGFRELATKSTENGIELVLVRFLSVMTGDICSDYPFIHLADRNSWLLAVYPDYHTRLLPDSILNNEPRSLVQDVSHTNTIHKIYIGKISLTRMSPGDIIILYRTSDKKGPAFFRSVATSVCVVEEVRTKKEFLSVDEFVAYCQDHSVFSVDELKDQYVTSNRLYTVKMTYNAAFEKRTTRGRLMEEAKISEHPRWDLRKLSRDQLKKILEMGHVNARIIID